MRRRHLPRPNPRRYRSLQSLRLERRKAPCKPRVTPTITSAERGSTAGWDDLSAASYDWPSVAEVSAYREEVRALVDGVIRAAPLTTPIGWNHPWWAIVMGIEHERIHLETSSVLIRQQRLDLVRPRPAWPSFRASGAAPDNTLVDIPAGEARLGKPLSDGHYGWDNEYGEHRTTVAAFQASRMLVSNGEYLPFVEGGSYDDDGLWDEEGRAWRKFAKAAHPTFWLRQARPHRRPWQRPRSLACDVHQSAPRPGFRRAARSRR